MTDTEDDPLAYLTDKEYLTLNQLVGRAYDHFWSQNELTVNKVGKVVRSDTPRRRPKTWFHYFNEDERERLTK